MPTGYQKLPFL